MELGNNLMSLLGQMNSPIAGAGLNPMALGAFPSAKGVEGFENLLELVSQMEIADSQAPGHNEDFEALLQNSTQDKDQESIKAKANEASLSLLVSGFGQEAQASMMNVGQQANTIPQATFVAAGSKPIETKLVNDLLLSGAELNAVEGQVTARQAESVMAKVDTQAMAQWASAMASGDMKSVGFVDDTAHGAVNSVLVSQDVVPSEKKLSEAVAKPVADKGLIRADFSEKVSDLKPSVNSTEISQASAIKQKQPAVVSNLVKGENTGELRMTKTDPQSVNVVQTQSKAMIKKAEPTVEFSKVAKPTSAPASEVLLDKASGNSMNGAVVVGASALALRSASGALNNPKAMGDIKDSRISSQALDFVAEKVERLKAQGGGILKIDLAPKELGAIEIKVGMRNGVLSVKMNAEHAATQSALDSSKADLISRLSKVGTATIEVVHQPAQFREASLGVVKMATPSASAASSESFMTARSDMKAASGSLNLSNSSQVQNLQADRVSASAPKLSTLAESPRASSTLASVNREESRSMLAGSSKMESSEKPDSSSSSWSRDDRREQAMEKWQQKFSSQRKSA